MSHSSEDRLSADLLAVGEQLSEGKHEASALDLDQIKMRAVAKATRGSATFAPRKGSLMRKRSLLTTALIVGVLASGTGATMAVTGQFSAARDDRPTASVSQYQSCAELVRQNRRAELRFRRQFNVQHRLKKRAHRRVEARTRGRKRRKAVRRINRKDERQQKRQHRQDIQEIKADHREDERRCREGRSR